MTVEFVKIEISEGENWEQEGNFFSGDDTSECAQQRSVKEYSLLASGSVLGAVYVYDEAISKGFKFIQRNW